MANKGVHHDRRLTKIAESAITGARFVKNGTIDNGVVPCGAGEQALGVAPYDIALNDPGLVVNSGIVEVDCAGVINLHAPVKSDGDGKAVAATSGDEALGTSQDLGAADTKIRVLLHTDSLSLMP